MKNPFFNIKKNLSGVISLIFIILIGLIALFGYVIAPDNSKNANQMHLSIHSKPPGFQVDILVIPNEIDNQSSIDKFFNGNKNPETQIPITNWRTDNNILFYQEYDQYQYDEVSLSSIKGYQINNKTFHLGTDKFGRDVSNALSSRTY